jgi:Uma2 family endonuclease
MATDHHEMTVEEWAALPDEEPGELVDGRLVEEEVPDFVHEVVVAWLLRVLGSWVSPRGGIAGGSGVKYALGPRHGRKPDVSMYLPSTGMPNRRGVVRRPPDLAVEILSPRPRDARRDRIEKHEEYARFGIRHYWLVDPEARMLEAFELDAGRYVRVAAATEGKIVLPSFDGLELDLDALWAETDRLESE